MRAQVISRKVEDDMTNADKIRNMNNTELAVFLENAENEGYNDSSVARDENGRIMDMLEWLESEG